MSSDDSDGWESDQTYDDSDEVESGSEDDYYYCSSCKTYHANTNRSTFANLAHKSTPFSQDDVLYQHPVLNALDDLTRRPTQGPAISQFLKQSVSTYLAKQSLDGNSVSTKIYSHHVGKELIEKAKQDLQKFEKKEKQTDELVEEIVKFNLGDASNIEMALIELNIDGKIYKTTRKTIMRYESLIKVMIENKESGGFDIETDEEGRIIFRAVPHPDYFKYILMYFRGDEQIETLEITDEITDAMKKKFKFITEDFNMANLLELYDICNYFCVKDLLVLIEKKIESFGGVIDLTSLSEKYRHVEQEKEEYVERLKENELAITKVENQIRELLKQLKQLDEQKSKLISDKLRLKQEQDLIMKLIDMKASFKTTEEIDPVKAEEFDITFNIGGEEFSFKSTELLNYESSLLCKLMNKSRKENVKSIFLDRDPSLFSYIYKFIKNNILPTSLANQKQIKLINESKFFGIDSLTVKIDLFRYPVEELSEDDREMRETESVLRKLFTYDRENPLLDDIHVNLIPVFDNITDFYPVRQGPTENMLFDFETIREFPIIATCKEEFDYNFKTITENLFEGLDWNGVFIAGGAIQRCCRSFASLYNKKIVQTVIRAGAQDVDIFLYGLSKSEAEDKIRHIYSLFKKDKNVMVVRTKYTVTFSSPGIPAIQVVTRLYKSAAEILIGFDIDGCCVGYDGNKVWCLPRFRRAFSRRYNLVDVERQSLTYESRLKKYALRGFRVLIPGYNPKHVKKPGLIDSKYDWNTKDLSGLALLLHYNRQLSINPLDILNDRIENISISSSSDSEAEIEEGRHSDYGDFFCLMIMSYPFPYMMDSYNTFIKTNKSNFVCALNDVESIIDSKDILTANHNISANIEWITEQPGRQLLGSLHQVFDNFYACAYDAQFRKKKDTLY